MLAAVSDLPPQSNSVLPTLLATMMQVCPDWHSFHGIRQGRALHQSGQAGPAQICLEAQPGQSAV